MNSHSPKNRLPEELPVLSIQVVHAGGVEETDPNGACASAVFGATRKDINGAPGTANLQMRILRLRDLEPVPGATSVISGKPALLYRSLDLEIPLTREEMHRLLDHSLEPAEHAVLLKKYGMFHEIHEDFYDPDTGETFQPITGAPLA